MPPVRAVLIVFDHTPAVWLEYAKGALTGAVESPRPGRLVLEVRLAQSPIRNVKEKMLCLRRAYHDGAVYLVEGIK